MPDPSTLWDRVSKVIVFVAVVIAVLGLSWAVYLTNETHTLSQQNHTLSQESKAALSAHTSEIQTLAALEKQVAQVIDGLPAADQTLTQYAAALVLDLQALCAADHASCPALPSVK